MIRKIISGLVLSLVACALLTAGAPLLMLDAHVGHAAHISHPEHINHAGHEMTTSAEADGGLETR